MSLPTVGGRLHFGLLGPLEVTYDGRPLDLGRPKQRMVLAALLIDANTVASIDRFNDVLWPAGAAIRTAGNLPVYIANLRRLLEPARAARTPPERILTRAPGYLLRVDPGEYDVADFETLTARGSRHLAEGRPRAARRDLGEALSLWRGRAMDEFPFAELEAGRLEALRVAATEDRIEADLALGAHTAVVDELEHLVREYGLRERLVSLLMLALYRSGRQSEALRAYTAARELLDTELGLTPGPALARMEAAILAHAPELDWHAPPAEAPAEGVPAGVAPAPPAPEPFVGREAELAAMGRALADAAGGIVLVSGEPGIGKTRLVREAVADVAARGGMVAWGRCEEGDGAPPFWPWAQVVRALLEHPDREALRSALAPWGSELAQLVPEVKALTGELAPPPALDAAAARYRFFEAVAGFVERLAAHRPVAVVLDDLHWADPPSLQLTAHLARRLGGRKALLVATYRDVDPAPDERLTETLAILARLPGRLDLRLGGLTQEEVAEFIAQEAGAAAPAGVVEVVWSRAAGNPFFVGELIRLLVAEKRMTEESAAGVTVPWAVRQVIGRRLDRLPGATRQLLTVAAVAGAEFDLQVVAVAAGVDLDRALDLVDVAVAAGVVTEEGAAAGRLQFSHALVHETVYDQATRVRRSRLHAVVADALEQVAGAEAPASEVARHLYEAVQVVGPSRAVAASVRAATSAQAALAYEVAEDHLRRALDLVATMAPGPARDSAELDVQGQLAVLLTLVKGVAVAETAAAWTRATELAGGVDDQRRLLPSLWGLLSYAWASGDMKGARALGEHLLRLGVDATEPVVTAAAQLGLGSVALCCGDLEEGASNLSAAKELADAVPDDMLADVTHADLRVQVDSWLAMACHLAGDHERGRTLSEGALARARVLGNPFTVAIALAFAVFSRVLGDDAAGAGRLGAELVDHAGSRQLADFAFHARVATAWAATRAPAPGEDTRAPAPGEDAVAALEALPAAATASIRPWRPFWLLLEAQAWCRLGRVEEARRAVEDGLSEVDAMGASFCADDLRRLRQKLSGR